MNGVQRFWWEFSHSIYCKISLFFFWNALVYKCSNGIRHSFLCVIFFVCEPNLYRYTGCICTHLYINIKGWKRTAISQNLLSLGLPALTRAV